MTVINESIQVPLPVEVVRDEWDQFVNQMIIGPARPRTHQYRWYRAEREAEEGTVRFESIDAGATRVSVCLDYGDRELPEPLTPDELRGYVAEDLVLFRQYLEEGENRAVA
jgi:hypothetical protein